MKSKSTLFAESIESLFFPDKVIIAGGIIAILYVLNSGLLTNNSLVFFGSLSVYYFVGKFMKSKIRNPDKIHMSSAIFATLFFFVSSSILQVSDELAFGATSIFLNLILLSIIRDFWKISAHAFVYANTSTILTLIDTNFIISFVFLPLVIWSRIKLNRHTYSQVLMGSITGFLLPAFIYNFGFY